MNQPDQSQVISSAQDANAAQAAKGPTVILTGDRPTGPLHLGHYVGSLRNRVAYQNDYQQFIMLADSQALTDNMDDINKVHRNVVEVALDYLAVGIDPAKSTILIQSHMIVEEAVDRRKFKKVAILADSAVHRCSLRVERRKR